MSPSPDYIGLCSEQMMQADISMGNVLKHETGDVLLGAVAKSQVWY